MAKYILKMNPQVFMRKVIELYRQARIPYFFHPKIKRGKSRSISSLVEGLMAFFLSLNLTEEYDFYVDQQMKLEGIQKSIRPDVILCKNNEITHLVDIKTDLGWKRDIFADFCIELQKKIEARKSKKGTIQIIRDDGLTTQSYDIETSKELFYHIVIISNQNIPENKLKNNLEKIREANLKNVEIYILSSKVHPNNYGLTIDNVLQEMHIHNEEFTRLLENITK